MKINEGFVFRFNGKLVKVSTIRNTDICNLVYVNEPNKSAGQLTINDINQIIKNEKKTIKRKRF